MPFDEVEERIEASAVHAECSFRMTRVKGGRVRAGLAIRKTLADQLNWTASTKIGLLVGTGSDAGKLVLVPGSSKPVVNLYLGVKGSYRLNLGYVAALGDVECCTAPAFAKLLEDGKLEITLPNLADYPVDGAEQDEQAEEDDAPAVAPPPPSQSVPPATRSAGMQRTVDPLPADDAAVEVSPPGTVSRDGVIISVNPPAVSYDGNQLPLQPFQQRVMVTLLPSLTMGPIPAEFIAKKLGTTVLQISTTVQGLQVILGKVDLSVEFVRGVGYQIKKI